MSSVTFKNVNKVYSGDTHIVKDINLEIASGEFVVFLGPSGCGKSTTLRMLSGLEDISSGEILIDDIVVNDLNPKERNIAMVFQSYALYPHMTVAENIGFSLKMEGKKKAEIEKEVNRVAEMLQLTPLLKRKPRALSGGQRQRVAMGRAMVRTPKVFLFDEPLSNLDAKLRNSMRREIKSLHNKYSKTTVYVTHDQVEAMTLADRVVILRDGEIEQVGTPYEVYHKPASQFVASFIGTPTMNMMEGKLQRDSNSWHVVLGDQKVDLGKSFDDAMDGENVTLGIRPTDIHANQSEGSIALNVSVVNSELLGSTQQINAAMAQQKLIAEVEADFDLDGKTSMNLFFDPNRCHVFNQSGHII
ncbi:sn-glycerol-3-phosphate ABC transporter ATP-binding protein UgpC [Vibrio plantisponsor]|uniref:Sn-glycerol-3-phosphate ABC transporter ATP-binding protein UgpC n=1 Tax=Vibrio plantisponsor TaxID=664643 RepID=A0ABU4INH7_9VIBR|nr:sn-glycerol-3-phosphate ABC transporter ATP-binding protein UgpC [Vibrio plantisponsor]MDW6020122.1 sn-glycerol-3-phosphate ABC transporter ATP-binding protein UgpC [Vibrio plantisponsor]NNM40955.1 sn-glycerol-3-phosphate ABC transporter ATP-binding protein UgpC [Vibrio plantisponsor]